MELSTETHMYCEEEGTGYYTSLSIAELEIIQAVSPIVLKAVESIPCGSSQAFVICDYGTADGGVSLSLIHDCIRKIKNTYGSSKEVSVVYEDQSKNDFKSVYALFYDPVTCREKSFLAEFPGIYVTICGTNFYSQCLPSQSVHLGFSSLAMHWLSKCPCNLTKSITHLDPQTEPTEQQMYREQAASDWETILLHRAAELVPGGHLIIVMTAITKEGQTFFRTNLMGNSAFKTMTEIWLQFLFEGQISQGEHQQLKIGHYDRTEEELTTPLLDESSNVYKAGLRLDSVQTHLHPCNYHKTWVNSKVKGTVAAQDHANRFVASIKRHTYYQFYTGLCASRSKPEVCRILEEFYQAFVDKVITSPDDHRFDYPYAFIHIVKNTENNKMA